MNKTVYAQHYIDLSFDFHLFNNQHIHQTLIDNSHRKNAVMWHYNKIIKMFAKEVDNQFFIRTGNKIQSETKLLEIVNQSPMTPHEKFIEHTSCLLKHDISYRTIKKDGGKLQWHYFSCVEGDNYVRQHYQSCCHEITPIDVYNALKANQYRWLNFLNKLSIINVYEIMTYSLQFKVLVSEGILDLLKDIYTETEIELGCQVPTSVLEKRKNDLIFTFYNCQPQQNNNIYFQNKSYADKLIKAMKFLRQEFEKHGLKHYLDNPLTSEKFANELLKSIKNNRTNIEHIVDLYDNIRQLKNNNIDICYDIDWTNHWDTLLATFSLDDLDKHKSLFQNKVVTRPSNLDELTKDNQRLKKLYTSIKDKLMKDGTFTSRTTYENNIHILTKSLDTNIPIPTTQPITQIATNITPEPEYAKEFIKKYYQRDIFSNHCYTTQLDNVGGNGTTALMCFLYALHLQVLCEMNKSDINCIQVAIDDVIQIFNMKEDIIHFLGKRNNDLNNYPNISQYYSEINKKYENGDNAKNDVLFFKTEEKSNIEPIFIKQKQLNLDNSNLILKEQNACNHIDMVNIFLFGMNQINYMFREQWNFLQKALLDQEQINNKENYHDAIMNFVVQMKENENDSSMNRRNKQFWFCYALLKDLFQLFDFQNEIPNQCVWSEFVNFKYEMRCITHKGQVFATSPAARKATAFYKMKDGKIFNPYYVEHHNSEYMQLMSEDMFQSMQEFVKNAAKDLYELEKNCLTEYFKHFIIDVGYDIDNKCWKIIEIHDGFQELTSSGQYALNISQYCEQLFSDVPKEIHYEVETVKSNRKLYYDFQTTDNIKYILDNDTVFNKQMFRLFYNHYLQDWKWSMPTELERQTNVNDVKCALNVKEEFVVEKMPQNSNQWVMNNIGDDKSIFEDLNNWKTMLFNNQLKTQHDNQVIFVKTKLSIDLPNDIRVTHDCTNQNMVVYYLDNEIKTLPFVVYQPYQENTDDMKKWHKILPLKKRTDNIFIVDFYIKNVVMKYHMNNFISNVNKLIHGGFKEIDCLKIDKL